MGAFVPKFVAPEAWEQMIPQNVYAIRMSPADEPVRFRFGLGMGLYIEISKASQGHVVNVLDFESGEPTLAGKVLPDTQSILGRVSDCQIKIAQPIISRQHLELKVWDEKILVAKDLGSTNGTFLWKEIPIENLSELSSNEESLERLEKKFGIDMSSLLNEYSQSKGS
jgi:hypothetical protein